MKSQNNSFSLSSGHRTPDSGHSPSAQSSVLCSYYFLFLFLLALVIRIAGVLLRGEYLPAPDTLLGGEAGAMAQHLLAGRGFASPFDGGLSPSTHLPPIYPLFLAAVLFLQRTLDLGRAPGLFLFYTCLLLNLLASSFVPLVVAKIALALRWPSRAALLAGLAMCFCPEAIRSISLVWDEAFAALASTLLLWLLVTLLTKPTPTYASTLRLGIPAGLLSLLSPAFTPALCLAYLVGLFQQLRNSTQSLLRPLILHTALLLATVLLVGLPWHLRNWVFLDPPAPVFVRGNYFLEIWTSIHPITFTTENGRRIPHAVHPWWGSDPLLKDGQPLTEQQYFVYTRQRTLNWIHEKPTLYATHVLRQIDGFWLGIAEAQRWHKPWYVFFIPQGIPALLGLAGLALAFRSTYRPAYLALFTILLFFPLPFYFAGAALRYRHPIDPILYLGLGYMLHMTIRAATARERLTE